VRDVPRVTVAVVSRETVSQVRASLEHLVANTEPPYRLVVVDACYPKRTRAWLDRFAREHDVLLLRSDCALTPTEAHNAVVGAVDTEFIAFVDDNCFVRRGWLESLVRCADETRAGVVGPLYGFRTTRDGPETVHVLAGRAHIEVVNGRRVLDDGHERTGDDLDAATAELERTPAECAEFHCMLVRSSVFDDVGSLDEGLLSLREHLDLCMRAREAGHQVWIEPHAVAVFELPVPLPWHDLPLFVFRWSRHQNVRTLDYFAKKWNLDRPLTMKTMDLFVDPTRRLAYHFSHRLPDRVLHRLGPRVLNGVDRVVEAAVVAYQLRRRAHSRGIRVAYAPKWHVGSPDAPTDLTAADFGVADSPLSDRTLGHASQGRR
jgi:GT2 family glycosyltransferase